jgi:hypothetical protein
MRSVQTTNAYWQGHVNEQPPMPALPAPAASAAARKQKPVEIIMACEAGRISIGEWS